MYSNKLPPETENVSIDMINLNLNVPESMRLAIISKMYDYAAKHEAQPFRKMGCQYVVNLLYKPEYKNKRLLFCINSNNPNRPFVQMAFNPSGLTTSDLQLLVNNIKILLGDILFNKLYSEGNVSRLDIAFDIKNIIFEDLLFNRKLQRTCGYYKSNMNGTLGSVKLGSDTSKLQLRIYSKTKKDIAKKINTPPYPVTRIEAVVSVNQKLANIKTIKNPFKGLGVYKQSHLYADKRLPVCIGAAIFLHGLTPLLQQMEGHERQALEQLLTDHKIEMPPAEEVFGLWQKECDSFLELFRPPLSKVRSFSDLSPRKVAAEDVDEYLYYFHAEQLSGRLNGNWIDYVEPYTANKIAA